VVDEATRMANMRASHQKRKKYKGKMGVVDSFGGFKPRSHTHGGHSQANAGWTCDDTHDSKFGRTGTPSSSAGLAPYRVQMPPGRIRYIRGEA
jgi:hypothetical protein